ncbi:MULTISPECIES: peptide ABC transporter substrate-binding protein [Vagococcus]|uniref:Oligopeptide ABC transporter, periplasmic oligopeptide-binding protein OppA (TC 3.A.1.5.1) n=1 Tax=Vagococcus fluvialis bH819 TaxID=1255619 RepID=A0A1X6WN23_9ENTE|nr:MULTISPECIES: peptide ABC transporter substrate-binding protein [Vagococcus]SLM85680.1 Oligopeptide ABC transporter, periplasmic oligopeptide-binding protein OppA (TC 3.A.1.5.1) [Vagococcus fluvialis bH819]
MKMKRIVQGMMVASLTLLVACGNNESKDKKDTKKESKTESKTLKVVESAELPTMDLSKATDVVSFSAISQVMEGLYEFADDSTSQPALAKSVVEPTDEGKKYTIELKEDGKWSNGDPVTAHDFVYSWQRSADPKTASEYAHLFEGFKNYEAIKKGEKAPTELGVTAKDDYTLEIALDHPIPYLSSLLAKPTFYPQHQKTVEEKGDKYATSSENLVYNGAFKLADWDGTNISWKYVKNDQYRKAKEVKLDEIDVQVVKENGTSLNMFQADEVDIIQVKGEFAQQQADNKDLVIREYPSTYYLQYNLKNKLVANKNVREAITYAIDSEQLVNSILGDGSKVIEGFVPTGITNPETGKDFAKESGKLIKSGSKEAKAAWAKAKKELGSEKLEFSLLASDTDLAKKTAEYLQGTLEGELEGLKVNVSTVPFANRLDKMSKGDFDVVLAGWAATFGDPYDFLQLANTGTVQNYGKWEDETYAKLLEESSTTYSNDNAKRWDTLIEAHKRMMEELPYTPLYQSSESFLVKPEVKNLVYRALGSPYYKNVSKE